jgi:tetratricopeptide (TPR) repeat protein
LKNVYYISLALFLWVKSPAQRVVDSLKPQLDKAQNDTNRIKILYLISENEENELLWPQYNRQMYEMAEKGIASPDPELQKFYMYYLASALNNEAYLCGEKGEYDKAMLLNQRTLTYSKKIQELSLTASALNNIGTLYFYRGNIPRALEYYLQSLKIEKELSHPTGVFTQLFNIAVIYENQGDIPRALDCYNQALKCVDKGEGNIQVANVLNNIGGISTGSATT